MPPQQDPIGTKPKTVSDDEFFDDDVTSCQIFLSLLLDNDIPSTESRLREFTREPDSSRACADASSGRDRLSGGEVKTTCVRNVLIGMKDLCRKNGLNEVLTHYLVGRLAMDLCDSDPPNIN